MLDCAQLMHLSQMLEAQQNLQKTNLKLDYLLGQQIIASVLMVDI